MLRKITIHKILAEVKDHVRNFKEIPAITSLNCIKNSERIFVLLQNVEA